MSLTAQESNFIGRLQQKAAALLDLRDDLQREIALYNAEGFGQSITDADLQTVGDYGHITQAKMLGCITAFSDVLTALGDDVSGQAVNLVKMRG